MESQAVFDSRWKDRALAGDRDAAQLLVQVNIEPLYQFCFYRVGKSRHLCEEVVQETLVRAIRDLRDFDPDRGSNRILPWLTGLARNEVRRVVKQESETANLETLWDRIDDDLRTIFAGIESAPFSDEALQREETRELVNATMSQLPPHYRQALEAKYVTQQTVRDIAVAQSLTEKATESLLTRARRAFRETFLSLARNLDADSLT